MKIIKKDGSTQAFLPNKIKNRIATQAKGLKVNVDELFISIVPYIKDGITTTEIDEIIAFNAADKALIHPDYSIFGGRILMSRQSKLLGVPLHPVDETYNFFAAETFLAKYSKKSENKEPIELPSMMYERVAEHLHKDEPKYKKYLLEELHAKKINFATPTYTNAGLPKRNAMISCNLTSLSGDSLENLEDTLYHIALASKEGAGIGLQIDCLRSSKSMVSSFNNNAGGVVRFADMVQSKMRFYKQGDRSGSCALYLSVWHKDILPFLELTLPVGDEKLRTRDLFTAVNIDDIFMDCLLNDKPYYLFCPNDISKAGLKPLYDCFGEEFKEIYNQAIELGLGEEIQPKKIWDAIIRSQVESGRPYVFYKDNANKRNMQDNIGVIKQSNLCVSPDTQILTDDGYELIGELENKVVNVWNGEEFSETTIIKTGSNQKLLRVTTDSGYTLDCTPYHKFYVLDCTKTGKRTHSPRYSKVEAKDLKIGDSLIKFDLPIIEGKKQMLYPYENGFYSGDGCLTPKGQRIYLYGDKQKLEQYITCIDKWYIQENQDRMYGHTTVLRDKFFVPTNNFTIESRLKWLAGYLDADGTVTNNNGSQSLQITSVEYFFLKEIQLMLQTLGVDSKIKLARDSGEYLLPSNNGTGENKLFKCKTIHRLLINGNSLFKLTQLGLKCNRLEWVEKLPNRECSQFIKIQEITELPELSDTYCFNEPKRNMGMFNGILTGQCAEITSVSLPEYTSQCTLASINLTEHDDLKSIAKSTKVLVRALNKVIDINKWSDDWSENAGIDQRSLAIGVAGLADFLAKKKLSFESDEAKQWNNDIFVTMYKAAVEESHRLAVEQGRTYPAWEGSLYSKGETYIEGWSPLKQGEPIPVLNSLFLGLMPTASSAILLGSFESFQPIDSNIFTRKVGQGEFLVINKYLVNDLEEIGLWNKEMSDKIIANSGSIQNILEIPIEIRDRYKTVWEIPQKVLLDLAIIRNKYVDQSQSMNVYHSDAKYSKISSALVYAWKNGLKTGVYYTRTKSKIEENKKLSASEVKPTRPADSLFSCAGGGCDS